MNFRMRKPPIKPHRDTMTRECEIWDGLSLKELYETYQENAENTIFRKDYDWDHDCYITYLEYTEQEPEDQYNKRLEKYNEKLAEYNTWVKENAQNIREYNQQQELKKQKSKESELKYLQQQRSKIDKKIAVLKKVI